MADKLNDTLCIPMKLDAFVLNTSVCDGAESLAKIAPISQPNYTFLRLHDALIQSDILPHVDIHNAFDKKYNSRITNLDSGKTYVHRQGVYLHWMLPRIYRVGAAATEESKLSGDRDGLPDPDTKSGGDQTAPQFRPVPTRWLVIRHIREGVSDDKSLDIPEYKAWVLESDHQQMVNDVSDDQDLQIDISPFIAAPSSGKVNIQEQAEVFIGKKTPAGSWTEPLKRENKKQNVSLTILNGGNVLFPDFQQHNTNVFSVMDNFEYKTGNKVAYLERATADYYVIGWHAQPSEDPLFIHPTSETKRETRLDYFQMLLQSEHASEWKGKSSSAYSVCHGAMYNVKWNVNEKPKVVPADDICKQLHKSMPVAVGTTPLDSLLAYVGAHQQSEDDDTIKKVMQAIESIQKYLLVQEDTVDGQEQADDLLYSYNYDSAPGGKHYHLAGATNPQQPTEKPSDSIVEALAHLNREQARLDSLDRLERRVRWKLFARWWEYVTRGTSNAAEKESCEQEVKIIMDEWYKVNQSRSACEKKKDALARGEPLRDLITNKVIDFSVHPSFHTQRDPTLLVGNVQSAWPHDWLDPLYVRLNTDITTERKSDTDTDTLDNIADTVGIAKLPSPIQETAKALVNEFILLQSDVDGSKEVSTGTLKPLYHDNAKIGHTARRDEWGDTQPFFPLFLEWEAEYAHIDYSLWSLKERKTTPQGSGELSYGINDNVVLHEKWQPKGRNAPDMRMISGRVLVLPQPSFSLRSQIQQVFDQTPADELDKALHKDDRETLLKNLDRLTYLSSPLAGFHDHLLTMAQGTHITPTIRYGGEKLTPIDGALDPGAGFGKDEFEVMGTETDLSPYGHLVHVSTETGDSAFKPVTHGQFKFTKLNIIDKFGQVVHALDPRYNAPPQYLRPCLSKYYVPQSLSDGSPNVVEKPKRPIEASHFAQIPPHINQWARVNSEFVEKDAQDVWVPKDEWQNPIWGWMVYNYLDFALQFFEKDGTFYREVGIGGESGSRISERWLPIKRDDGGEKEKKHQLDHLIDSLAKKDSLDAFMNMIRMSLDHAAPAPDAYAQFLNSIVGRPLALVNMAWSLELATDEYKNQSKININVPKRSLLKRGSQSPEGLYSFPCKLGDEKRSYDGLVGYFKSLSPDEQKADNYLDLTSCYTFFGVKGDPLPASLLVKIDPKNYPVLEPYFIDPVENDAATMETKRNAMLAKNVFGAIVDPFVPVHGYTGILPIQPLKLPPWTWQDAMNQMTAFFHIGPLHVTQDVPRFEESRKLTTETDLKDPKTMVDNGIGLPAMGSADWTWLQPYCERKDGEEETSFMPLGLAGTETKPRFEEGPYTTVEGYLQLRQPIVRSLAKHD